MGVPDVWPFALGASNMTMAMDYDANNNAIYIGWAQPGALKTDTAWRISQQTYDVNNNLTDLKWPNASPSFLFVWANRTTYSYA